MKRPAGRRRRSSRLPLDWLPSRPVAVRPLAGQEWGAGDARKPGDDGRAALRAAALVAMLIELALLAWLVAGPAFQVRHVQVVGNHQLTAREVVAAAGLDRPRSLFTIDAATIRRKLTVSPWIRDASVGAALPDRVTLTVDEWQPVAVYAAGGRGRPLYLSDQALVLGAAPAAATGLRIDGPAGPDPRIGSRPLEPRLLTATVNIQRGLPGLIGQQVRSFTVDSCGNLTMFVERGWRVEFGRVITSEEYAALDQKLAALKSIATRENLNSPDLDYVNLQNPQLPAVGVKQRPAPSPTAAPAAPPAAPSPAAPRPIVTCR